MEFEKKIKKLEDILDKMEEEELSLDESVKFFEEGVKLTKECHAQLSKAEQKVKVLLGRDKDGEPVLEDFDVES